MILIETENLRKTFGPIEAVKGVSFRVAKGEVLGFLGPNGAGKSTVMRMLTCFLTPTGGTARIGGHDVQTDSMAARRMIGYVPEANPLYVDMNPQDFLGFVARMRGFSGAEAAKRVDRVVESCWLTDVRRQTIDTLSKGFKRRVGLAQALLHDPEVLILDEPTDGLDPNQKHEVRTLIRRMAAEKAIVISTHILEEVDAVCSRAVIIANGRIVVDGTPTDLRERSRIHGTVRLAVLEGDKKIDDAPLLALDGIKDLEREETGDRVVRWTLFPEKGRNVLHEVALLAEREKWQVEELCFQHGSLKEVFREMTTHEVDGRTLEGAAPSKEEN